MRARLLSLVVANLLVVGVASAAPCTKQDWSQYLALNAGGGCTLGGDTLNEFSFNAGNSGLAADAIVAQPIQSGLLFIIDGFRVENEIQGLTASKSFTIDMKITGKHPIFSLTLEMPEKIGKEDHPILNNGNAGVTDMLNGFAIDALAGRFMATKALEPPLTSVKVEESVSVSTGMNKGASAQLKQFSVRYHTTPEPGTWLLIIAALSSMPLVLWRARCRERAKGSGL